jgi:hypothetical protein
MTDAFVHNIKRFVATEGIDFIAFDKGQRKDNVTQAYFKKNEGVLYVGKAQEKARGSCGPSVAAARARERPIRGLWNPRPWSTITIFIAWTRTLDRSS